MHRPLHTSSDAERWSLRSHTLWRTSSNSGTVCKPLTVRIDRGSKRTEDYLELEDIVSAECGTHEELIDNALRAYLSFTANYKGMLAC